MIIDVRCQVLKALGKMNGLHDGIQMVCTYWVLQPSRRTDCFSVFAQQGYFSVLINPTGSTTFGQGTCYH